MAVRLQIALDSPSMEDAVRQAGLVGDTCDIIEVGTPLILAEGMAPVRELRRRFPGKAILADTKIMDGGAVETGLACDAGANFVTVMGVTDNTTVSACLDAAQRRGVTVVVDMMCVADIGTRVRGLLAVGASAFAVHLGVDQQTAGRSPLGDLIEIRRHTPDATVFVAGGITLQTLPEFLAAGADIVVVGSAIATDPDPKAAAQAFRTVIEGYDR